MSMRSSVGRRKSTNVKHRPPSKPKFDSESDSESLPDVLRESKSGSVSEEEEKENKSVMSSTTDGGRRAVKSLRSRSRKQNTTKRIPQKTSADLSESQTDIFDSLSDGGHPDGEGSSEGNQDEDITSKLKKEAKVVAELILDREKVKSSTETSENGSQNDSVVEKGAIHLNGVESATDEDSVKQEKDVDEDVDNIPESRSISKTRSGAKTRSKEKDVEIIEDSTGEGDDEIETGIKSLKKQPSSKDDEEDDKETSGDVEDVQEEKCGSKDEDGVSKAKNVTENGINSDGDEITPEDKSQSSNDEAVVDNVRRTSRRKQMKEKIQRVEEDGEEMESVEEVEEDIVDKGEKKTGLKKEREDSKSKRSKMNKSESDEDGGEMESVEDMEEEIVDKGEKKTRSKKEREDSKSKRSKRNKSESDEDGDDESTAEEDKTNKRELRKRKSEDKHKQRKVSEEDGSSSDEEGENRNKRKLRRRKNQRGRESEDSSQVDQSSGGSDVSYDASSANDFLQDFKGIRCTSCYQQLNQYNRKSLCQHPTLDVLVCRRCIEYYHEGDFTKDDEGADEQCQWCGEGGNLICCDFCPSAFCKTCICRNLSRKEWTLVSTNETNKWHCYVCNKKPISDLIKSCKAVIRWAEKSAGVPPSKPIRRDDTTRGSSSKPYKQLCAYLEGRSDKWNYFQNELEKNKKSVSQMKKKELLHTILNIRSFRKYLKSYQDYFEHGLEEIMSSGEISGGETATDSLTAKEDTGLKENAEPDEKEGEDNSNDDEEMTTPKKKENSIRRIKTTPKRNSISSDREKSGNKQMESEDQDSSDDDDDATTLEEDEGGMKEGSCDDMKDNSKQKEKGDAEATDEKKTRKSSKVKPKVSKRKDGEKTSEEVEEDGDSENTSDEKEKKKTHKTTKETARIADEEEDSVSLIDVEEDITLTDGTEDEKNQVSESAGKDGASNDEVRNKVDKPQSKSDEEKEPSNETSPDESTKDDKLSGKRTKRKKNKEVVTDGTKDEKNQVSAGKAGGRNDEVRNNDKPQNKDDEEKEPSNETSPDESTKDDKLSGKRTKGKKDKEVVSEDGKQEDAETKEEEGEEEEDDDGDDFEKMLLDDIESNEEESEKDKVNKKRKKVTKKKDDKSDASSDKEGETLKKSKANVLKARKSLSKNYEKDEEKKSKVKTSKYVETGSTSDTEVSLIDLDIADEQERKRKKLKKRQKKTSNSDSDTDVEVEKLVEKASKRKNQSSSDEDSQQDVENANGTKKKREKSSSNKRRRKGSSGSDIDSEIDRLDDLNFRSNKKGKSKGSKKQPSKQKDKKKKSGKKSSTSDDSDEELPEISYDTDPELLQKGSQKKEDIKLEDAEEQYAEKMLVKELESDEKDKNDDNDSSSDSEGDKNGEVKKKSKGGGKEGKGEKKSESENGKRGSKKGTDGSDDDKGSSQSEKPGKKKKNQKVHKLLKGKLISSSSSSDSGEEWGKKKKKINEMLKKEGKSSESGKKKKGKKGKKGTGGSDSDFTISDSSDSSVGKKKNKRNKSQSSGDDSSDDSMPRRRRSKRKRKGSDSDKGSSDDFAKERKKLRSYQQGAKEKKKSRIKQAFSSGSDSDVVGKKKKRSDDSGSDIEDSQDKGKGRKKIRKLMKKKQLTKETIDAAAEERERRKRVQKKRQELIAKEMDSPQKSSVLQEVVLDRDPETNETLLEIDKKLVKVLKPHQAKGIQFMWDCTFENMADADKPGSGCILAHCMGLGKTLQVIAFLHAVMLEDKTGIDTALVVAPLNTVLNWQAEFEKWQEDLEYEINVFELASYKDNASRADVLKQWQREGGVMIMGYTMYRNLCQSRFVKKKRQKEVFAETLINPGPDLVVCDEGHLLKNDATATAIAMNNIRTKRRICLTGTPLQNNLIEYHCMVQFVKPMLLGTRKEFSNRFVNPISNGQCADSSPFDVKLMKKRAHILHNLLSGSVQRKDYSALAPYLPPKHEFVVLIRLSKKQIELYERYLENYGAGSGGGALEGRPTSLFKDYQVLMNVWTHPRLLKLAAIRTEKKRQSEELKTFIDDVETEVDTSEEDEVVEHVRDSSSEDEIIRAAKEKKLTDDIMNAPGTSGEQRNGRRRRKSGDSDSSVEVIKTWNTRRTRGDGEDDFPEDYEPPPPKKEWFTDLVDDEDNLKIEISGKMILLFEILKLAEAVGEKVLLFSQSLLTLDLIEDLLEDQALKNVADNAEKRCIKLATSEEIEIEMETWDTWVKGIDYFRIDGSTEAHTRKAMSDKFNDVANIRSRLFIVSTRAGSLGINLVAASRVIIFDACWNPSHDIQSIFRVYRFGQEKAVYIYRFIAQGTMEERIYDRQVTKQSLAQRVVDEHQVKRHYTFTELNELYNFQPDRLDDPNRKEQPTPILPKDFILAELLHCQKDWIVNYHEHDSLLENVVDESLTEEERKIAWSEYEAEKEGRMQQMVANPSLDQAPGSMPTPMSDQLRQMQARMPQFNHSLFQRFAQAAQYHQTNSASNPAASPFMSMARILQLSNQAAQQSQGQNQPQLPGSSYTVRIPGIPQPVVTHRIPPPSMNHRPGLPGQTQPGVSSQGHPRLPGQAPGGHPRLPGQAPGQAPGLPGQAGLSTSSLLMQALSRQAQSKNSNPPTTSMNHVVRVHPGAPQPPSEGNKKS